MDRQELYTEEICHGHLHLHTVLYNGRPSGHVYICADCGYEMPGPDLSGLCKVLPHPRALAEGFIPVCITYRGETALVWRTEDRWSFGFILGSRYPESVKHGYPSRAEAERWARKLLAWKKWDGQETESEILLDEQDKIRFAHWARERLEMPRQDASLPKGVKELS